MFLVKNRHFSDEKSTADKVCENKNDAIHHLDQLKYFATLSHELVYTRRSQSMGAKAYGSVLISGSNVNLFMGFC